MSARSGGAPQAVRNLGGQATRRIMRLFNSATNAEYAEGLAWYGDAHFFAAALAHRHDLTVTTTAGVIAALSPRCSWRENKRNADMLVREGNCPGLTLGKGRALRILGGEDPLAVLGGPKVRSFYDNILDPVHSTAVTVDSHAYDIAAGRILTTPERKQLDRAGEYDRIADMYRSAAQRLYHRPSEVQAVTWVAWRNRHGRFAYQRV